MRFCAQALIICNLDEHQVTESAKGSGSISQASKITPATVNWQLKKSLGHKWRRCFWSSVKSTLQRNSKKSDGIEKVNKRLIPNIYMQAIHH